MIETFFDFILLNIDTISSIKILNCLGLYYQYISSYPVIFFGLFDAWFENLAIFFFNKNTEVNFISWEKLHLLFAESESNENNSANLYNLSIYLFIKKYYLGFFLIQIVIVYVIIQILVFSNVMKREGFIEIPTTALYLKGTLLVLFCAIFFKIFELWYFHSYFSTFISSGYSLFTSIFTSFTDYYLNFIYIFVFSLYFLYLYNQLVLKILNNLVWDINAEILLLLNIATFLNLKLITCSNLLYFLLLLESLTLVLIVVCVTMGFLKEDMKSAEEAGFKLYINNAVSSGFLLLGISLIYGITGLVDIRDIAFFFTNIFNLYFSSNVAFNAKEFILIIGFIFFFVGIFTKLMQSPFHLWAKDIYEGSSFYFTTYLATISKVGILLFFVNFILVFHKCIILLKFCIFIGFISTLIGILGALQQKKIKSFIAYSSIAAIGPLLIICGSSLFLARSTLLTYLILPYVLSYVGLLLLLLIIIGRFGKIYIDNNITTIKAEALNGRTFRFIPIRELSEFSGLWFKHKLYSIFILILLLTLIAIPPFFNFLLKTYLVIFLVETNNIIIAFIFLLYGVMGCLYYLKLIKLIIFDNPNNHVHILKASFSLNYGLVVLLTFLILGFIYPKIISILLFYFN